MHTIYSSHYIEYSWFGICITYIPFHYIPTNLHFFVKFLLDVMGNNNAFYYQICKQHMFFMRAYMV